MWKGIVFLDLPWQKLAPPLEKNCGTAPDYCFISLSLNFIYFTKIMKQVIQLILFMPVCTDVCVLVIFVWRRKPEYLAESHLSDLVTTWPSHMPTPGIEYRLYSFHIYVYEVDCHIFTSIEIILSLIIEGWMWKYLLLYSIALRTLSLSLMDRY